MKTKLTKRSIDALKVRERPYEIRDTEIQGFLLRVQPTGLKTYFLDYRPASGKRNRYRIGVHGNVTVAQARDIALSKAGAVADAIDIQAEKKAARRDAERAKVNTLGAFLDRRYGPWVVAGRKSGVATLARLRFNFSSLMNRPLGEINTWVLENWRTGQRVRGKADTTINRDIVALKAVLARAVRWGLLASSPLAGLRPIKTDQRGSPRYLSLVEEKRLRRALLDRETRIRTARVSANEWRAERGHEPMPDLAGCAYVDHLQPMVLVAMNTGARRGELFNLRWGDVDFGHATLTVKGATAKSGQTRHLPLNAEAVKVLRAWMRQRANVDGFVFPGKAGNRLDNVKTSWMKLLRDADIHGFRFHDLRHHFASRLVMEGVDLNTVRELLGHADIAMTLRYAHLAPEHKALAVARIVRQ